MTQRNLFDVALLQDEWEPSVSLVEEDDWDSPDLVEHRAEVKAWHDANALDACSDCGHHRKWHGILDGHPCYFADCECSHFAA